jgi:hypothetical protein
MDIVVNGPDGFTFAIAKTFVTGVPANNNQVEVRANKFQTTTSLFENLVAFNSNQNIDYGLSLSGDEVFLNFVVFGDYTVTVNELGENIEVSSVPVEEPEPEPADPTIEEALANGYFQIQIIDTVEDDRELIVELTRANSPVLNFQGSDDIEQTVYAGNLSFDMRVAPSTDAHFIHLFTGDEYRFLVKLNIIDPDENSFLIWQGYLVPSEYSEPYVQVQQFVSFKATDMLAALKGKKLPPWYYFQKLPVMFLLSEILKLTGLEQEIIMKPGVFPVNHVRGFESIIIDMQNYRSDKDFTDVYKILEDILEGFGMVLYSIKGRWMIESYARRNDNINEWLKFDYTGKRDGFFEYEKTVRDFDFVAGSINITAITPFNKIIYRPNVKTQSNLYPDDIAEQDFESLISTLNGVPNNNPNARLNTNINRYWSLVQLITNINYNNNLIRVIVPNGIQNKRVVLIGPGPGEQNYNVNASLSQLTYYECNIRPFLLANNRYRLRINATVRFEYFANQANTLRSSWEAGRLNQLFVYRGIINDDIVVSNSPIDTVEANMRPQLSFNHDILPPPISEGGGTPNNPPAQSELKITLDCEFPVSDSGDFILRIFRPIGNNIGVSNWVMVVDSLALDILTEENYVEEIVAERPVNFSTIKELTPDIISTANRRVTNGINISYPIFGNYFYELDRTNEIYFESENPLSTSINFYDSREYFGSGKSVEISDNQRKILFGDLQMKNAVFIESTDGTKKHAPKTLNRWFANKFYLAYLESFEPIFRLPKNIEVTGVLQPGDKIKYMYVAYSPFNFSLNDSWKTFDDFKTGRLGECLSYLTHSIYSTSGYKFDGEMLGMIFPDELFSFFFDGEEKRFVPTSINIVLFRGKTTVTGRECNYEQLEDITYV